MKEKLLAAGRKVMESAVPFLSCLVLLRGYEWVFMPATEPSTGSFPPAVFGLLTDIYTGISFSAGVLAVCLIVGLFLENWVHRVSVTLFAILLLVHLGVTHYFVTTLVPLGADLLGYSLSDIFTTVGSSGSLGAGFLLFGIFLFAAFSFQTSFFHRQNTFHQLHPVALLVVGAAGLITWVLPAQPTPQTYERDADYYVATDKLGYLFGHAFRATQVRSKMAFAADDYPFLHTVDYADPLGEYMNKAPGYPTIVFIFVEGLGRDFVGKDAAYAGFTPFLDSLTEKSLYWKNGLSNAGRTYGAPPSILGSLPYGSSGLMNYGTAMPDHRTILSLLKPFGYHSRFFYGGNANFDNLDLFLERQGIDQFVNQSSFPASFREGKKLSAWGFEDADVFSFSARVLKEASGPRIDVYLTLSTHEPFLCPDPTMAATADRKLETLPDSRIRKRMLESKNIFECLMYTDHALKNLFAMYAQRADYAKTIFILTGDHRLIPLPSDDRLSRFHVPLIIFSPLLKQARTFSSVAIHSAITPTVLGLLHHQYGMNFPPKMPFISGPLLTDTSFTSNLDVALTRTKNSVTDYMEGTNFLSEDRLYRILPDFTVVRASDGQIWSRLKKKLADFQDRSLFACENNRLDKIIGAVRNASFALSAKDREYLNVVHSDELNPDQQLAKAQELAFTKDYIGSRILLKNLLNNSPNYHDARILLARTFGWNRQYDSAIFYLRQTLERSPNYSEAYLALSDVFFWRGDISESLKVAEKGLSSDGKNEGLLVRKARALEGLGRRKEAWQMVEPIVRNGSRDELALNLMNKLKNN